MIRAEGRGRLIVPFLLGIGLLGLKFLLGFQALIYRGKDVRYAIFGKDLRSLTFAAAAAFIFFVVRLLDIVIFDLAMSRRRNVIAPQLLRQILAIGIYFLAFAWALNYFFNYSVRTALAGGALLAAILGLALQDTLGNLFSGMSLHLEGAFEVGDVLHSGDFIGTVESVSWRATRVRGFNNQVLLLPNSVIARERLEIFPHNNLNARVLQVGVDYHVAPASVIGILTQAAAHVEGVARDRPCVVRVAAFADSAVVYEVKYFTRDYSMRDRIDADVRKAIWYALQRNHIAFATPIRSYAPYTPPKTEQTIGDDEILRRLREVDILSPLSDGAHDNIARETRVHVYSNGEAVLRHGEAGDSMFVIHSGTVSVRIADDEGTGVHEVAQLGPGTVVGEMALLTGEARTADVVAVTDVVALEIGKESLQPILHDHPELAGAITERVMERRDHLESVREAGREVEKQTVLDRIRAYFAL